MDYPGKRPTVRPDEGSGDTSGPSINFPGKRPTVWPDEGSGDTSGPSITQVRGLQSGQMREVVTCLGHR